MHLTRHYVAPKLGQLTMVMIRVWKYMKCDFYQRATRTSFIEKVTHERLIDSELGGGVVFLNDKKEKIFMNIRNRFL